MPMTSPLFRFPSARLVCAIVIGCAVWLAAIYGIRASEGNAIANKERFSVGEMAAFVFKEEWRPAEGFTFVDAAGAERTMEDWRGRVVLLNLWATWCAPCRREMPALDRLQAALGDDDFEVVALSVDRNGAEASAAFLAEVGASNLALYVDATTKAMFALRARGLPATYLIDREGRIIGHLIGPAEWDQQDAVQLVRGAIDGEILTPEQ